MKSFDPFQTLKQKHFQRKTQWPHLRLEWGSWIWNRSVWPTFLIWHLYQQKQRVKLHIWSKTHKRSHCPGQYLCVRPEGVYFLHHPFEHTGALKQMQRNDRNTEKGLEIKTCFHQRYDSRWSKWSCNHFVASLAPSSGRSKNNTGVKHWLQLCTDDKKCVNAQEPDYWFSSWSKHDRPRLN